MKINKELFKRLMLDELEYHLKDNYKSSSIAFISKYHIIDTMYQYINDMANDREFNIMSDIMYLLYDSDYVYKTINMLLDLNSITRKNNIERLKEENNL